MKAFRIKQWDEAHETHESRKLQFLNWSAIPNKHDGLGFSHLRASSERVDLYCAWALMVQLAGKGRKGERGWLIRGNRALTTGDMAMMTGFPQAIFDKAVQFFVKPEVNWLDASDFTGTPADTGTSPARPAGTPADTGTSPARPAAILPTDRQGDRQTDREYQEREKGGSATDSVQASRTQAGALLAGIAALEKHKADLLPPERIELRKKKRVLDALQKKQAAGDFSPLQEELTHE